MSFPEQWDLPMRPRIIVLLGPIAVGKTTIGRLLECYFECQFLSPEEFFVSKFATVDSYRMKREEAYAEFERTVRETLSKNVAAVVIEEIALSATAFKMLQQLRADYQTRFIGVIAEQDTCLHRLGTRGTDRNFPATEPMLIASRDRFQREVMPHFPLDFTINNEGSLPHHHVMRFDHLLKRRTSAAPPSE